MKKNIAGLIILCILIIIIAVDLAITRKDTPLKDRRLITDVDWGGVTGLKIKSPDSDLEFYKINGIWYVIKEKRYRADQDKVQALLNSLSVLEKDNILTGPDTANPERFNLDKPPVSLEILQGERSTLLNFGTTNPAGRNVYCQFAGDKDIYLTNGYILIRLFWGFDQYRDKALFHFNQKDIVKIDLSFTRGRDYDIRLLKINGSWQMDYPVMIPADNEYVELLLLAAKSLQAVNILDKNGKGEDNIRFRLTISDKNSNHHHLKVGEVNPDNETYYLFKSDSEPVYEVSIESVNKLMMNKYDLAGRRIIDEHTGLVNSIAFLVPGEKTRTITRESENRWKNKDTGTEIKQETVEKKIFHLSGLDVVSLNAEGYLAGLENKKPAQLEFSKIKLYFCREENFYAIIKFKDGKLDPRVWRIAINQFQDLKKFFSD